MSRSALLASAATIVLAAANVAGAADLPLKAPPPVPAFSWTGCYAGAQVGWGWGHSTFQDHSFTNVHFINSLGGTGYLGYSKWAGVGPGLIDTGSGLTGERHTASVDQSGGLFGGQLGCDYQFTNSPTGPNFVIGVSGSAAGADINGTNSDPYSYNLNAQYYIFDGPKADSVGHSSGLITSRNDFLADVSGRLGLAWGQALFYAKGGVAWSQNNYTADTFGGGTVSPLFSTFYYPGVAGANTSAFTAASTLTGALAGAGAEWAFSQHWSAFVEYNHYFFPERTLDFQATGFNGHPFPFGSPGFAAKYDALVDVRQSFDTVKVGVNYRFNFGPPPLVSRY